MAAVNLPPPIPAAATPPRVAHYENFPVASLLCPARLRAPIRALYAFARTADDLADEGDASAGQRLADLQAFRADLHAIAAGGAPSPRWAALFATLQVQMQAHRLPQQLLDDLLDAFVQDVEMTQDGATYADHAALLGYCSRSANPVGRLLLHLYGVHDAPSLRESDAICSALQLINFWQDLSVDIPRGRHYVTDADCAAHGVSRAQLQALQPSAPTTALLAALSAHARALMLQGAPLARRLPGRVGWELRLVVQGGLRILDRIDALQGGNLCQRPTLGARDWLVMLTRAVRM